MAGTTLHEENLASPSGNSQLATFRIGTELFGLDIRSIREIVRYPEITGVPRSPAYLAGLANMRGNVLPVIDTRTRLGVEKQDITDITRVLVIETEKNVTGLMVDEVCGVISLEGVATELPPPLLLHGVETKYIQRVIKADNGRKIIMEIDADALCFTEIEGLDRPPHTSKQQQSLVDVAGTLAEIQLVTFLVAHEEYAFPIESVREVLRIGDITEVPDVAPYLLGVLSIRNTLLPVVDVRRLFALPSLEESLTKVLDDLVARTQHVKDAFMQYVQHSGMWNMDSSRAHILGLLDSLYTSSDLLGRYVQSLRLMVQKIFALMEGVRQSQGNTTADAERTRVLEELDALAQQITLRGDECKNILAKEIQEDQRILVIEIGQMPVGILVDRMQQVIRLPENIIDQPPLLLNSDCSVSLKGIVKLDQGNRLIMLINEEQLFGLETLSGIGSKSYEPEQGEECRQIKKDESVQLVTFRLGTEVFGISIDEVQEINRLENITAVPRSPAFVEGVMNLRGNVIPAIDLRKRFGLECVAHDESTRVMIVLIKGNLTGLIVDSVSEVYRLDRRLIENPPDVLVATRQMNFIQGICKDVHNSGKMIMLIDVAQLFDSEELHLLDTLADADARLTKEKTPARPDPVQPVASTIALDELEKAQDAVTGMVKKLKRVKFE